MRVNFGMLANTLSGVMYNDKCTIYRHIAVIDDIGLTHNHTQSTPSMLDIPCHVQMKTDDKASVGNQAYQEASQEISFFVHPSNEIMRGDRAVLKKMLSKTNFIEYKGVVGEPRTFPTHIKATLELETTKG